MKTYYVSSRADPSRGHATPRLEPITFSHTYPAIAWITERSAKIDSSVNGSKSGTRYFISPGTLSALVLKARAKLSGSREVYRIVK